MILIVVPFGDLIPSENRRGQLSQFLAHFKPIVRGNIRIIIVEQITPTTYFNRGQLINIGVYWFHQNIGPIDVIISHDVDMLPNSSLFAEYVNTTKTAPISLVPLTKTYYRLYKGLLPAGGGIFAIPYSKYRISNGYPNTYWGWGGEDNAFESRLKRSGISWRIVKKGDIKHIDTNRSSNQTKMAHLLKNKVRSMMVRENMLVDKKNWKDNGYAQVPGLCYKIDCATKDGDIYHIKVHLDTTYLDETIKHNAAVYEAIDKTKNR